MMPRFEKYTYLVIIALFFLVANIAALCFHSFFDDWNRKIGDNFFRVRSALHDRKTVPRYIVNVIIDDAFIE